VTDSDNARDAQDTPLQPPDVPLEEKGSQLTGDQPEGDQVAYVRQGEVSDADGPVSQTEIYQGELEAGAEGDEPTGAESVELLTERELRAGETNNPDVAAEEGMTYVPPMDPPVVPSDDPEGATVAAGFASSALDEPYDRDHPSETLSDEDDMSARVREALRADAITSRYADSVAIGTRGGVVALRGWVDDVEDSDNMAAVASRVSGVEEVVDELEVRALEGR
jgi:hypothetical protein